MTTANAGGFRKILQELRENNFLFAPTGSRETEASWLFKINTALVSYLTEVAEDESYLISHKWDYPNPIMASIRVFMGEIIIDISPSQVMNDDIRREFNIVLNDLAYISSFSEVKIKVTGYEIEVTAYNPLSADLVAQVAVHKNFSYFNKPR
jgi:hypothetical protein